MGCNRYHLLKWETKASTQHLITAVKFHTVWNQLKPRGSSDETPWNYGIWENFDLSGRLISFLNFSSFEQQKPTQYNSKESKWNLTFWFFAFKAKLFEIQWETLI